MRRCFFLALALALVLSVAKAAPPKVRMLYLQGEITMATSAYVAAQAQAAANEGDECLFFVIDSHDGMAQAADEIVDLIQKTEMTTIAYVQGRGWGAGALVALSADKLFMSPFSTIGDIRTLPDTPRVREALKRLTESVAAARGLSPEWALPMAEGKTYTAYEAVDAGAVISATDDLDQALLLAGYDGAERVTVKPDLITRFSAWLAYPAVIAALFTLGLCFLLVEAFGKGLGLPGLIGLSCMALFYGGGLLAGYARWWSVALFGVAAVLAICEVTTPGFFGLGVAAVIALVLSLYFGSRTFTQFLITLASSLLGVALTLPIALRRFFRLRGAPPGELERRG